MATLYVTVWEHAGEVALGEVIQEFTLSFTTSSVQTVAITPDGKKFKRVRIFSDGDCFVTWGDDPTAASGSARPMGAENPEYFAIQSGYKIAVINR